MAAPAEVSAAERARRRQAAAAAGTTATGPASTALVGAPKAPASAAARASASAAILAGLVAFLSALRRRDEQWLGSELAKRASPGKTNAQDIAELVAEEERRGQAFAEGVVRRVTADLAMALAIPDPAKRGAAVQGILSRERTYAAQRGEAMAARAFAGLERIEVRHDSPQGAFWKLDPNVAEHTAGCLIMGGKFWPWAVLDRVHPPRHPGCPCRLKSWGSAVADGDMNAGDVPDVRAAVRSASGVVMEAVDAERILEELDLRDRLVEGGLASAEALARIPLAVS